VSFEVARFAKGYTVPKFESMFGEVEKWEDVVGMRILR